jgi:hypothetical protein
MTMPNIKMLPHTSKLLSSLESLLDKEQIIKVKASLYDVFSSGPANKMQFIERLQKVRISLIKEFSYLDDNLETINKILVIFDGIMKDVNCPSEENNV